MNSEGYAKPKRNKKADGQTRRVGFELEFAGLSLKQVGNILEQELGGELRIVSQAEAELNVPDLGEFAVELDWRFGKETARERAHQRQNATGKEASEDPMMEFFTKLAGQIVPMEIVCPPIELDKLERLDSAVKALREAGAKGTEDAVVYAFGVHINPELPDTDASTICAYLQSYALAQDWLIKAHKVDLARRVTPYIDAFPKAYLRTVLDYSADVSQQQLIDDYLHHNPTRNRALDMLPLFKHLDADRVQNKLDDPRIKARPTFHYRLPNCEIEHDGWYLSRSWNRWCIIEQLAADNELRAELISQWHQHKRMTFERPVWHKRLDQILENLLSA